MSEITLSILIPSVKNRSRQLDILFGFLIKQIVDYTNTREEEVILTNEDEIRFVRAPRGEIEIIIAIDNKEISVGKKRDILYQKAKGKYSWQIDDDDNISFDGIQKVMDALKEKPDCVTFQEHCLIDNVEFKSNHSRTYTDWEGDGQKLLADGFHYHRTPFFKSVIRTDYCNHIGVGDRRFGEDHEFAILIHPMLVKEVHIDEDIYLYRHVSSPHNERYGIKERIIMP